MTFVPKKQEESGSMMDETETRCPKLLISMFDQIRETNP